MTYEEFQKEYDFNCGPNCESCLNCIKFLKSVKGADAVREKERLLSDGGGHPLSCSIWKDAVCDCVVEPSIRDALKDVTPKQTWFSVGQDGKCHCAGCDATRDGHIEEPDVVASDTERPPSPNGRRCYFCNEPAEHIIHVDMPACADCKRRAVGRRSK